MWDQVMQSLQAFSVFAPITLMGLLAATTVVEWTRPSRSGQLRQKEMVMLTVAMAAVLNTRMTDSFNLVSWTFVMLYWFSVIHSIFTDWLFMSRLFYYLMHSIAFWVMKDLLLHYQLIPAEDMDLMLKVTLGFIIGTLVAALFGYRLV